MGKRMRAKMKRGVGPSKGNAKKMSLQKIKFANTPGEIPEAAREETPEPTQRQRMGR
jgi:hypothetical protein